MYDIPLLAEFALALGIGYFFTAMYLLSHSQPKKKTPFRLPNVVVIVAMRDEAENIIYCLQSLKKQTYPEHLYKVYIADDRSQDASRQLVSAFIQNDPRFKLISITEDKFSLKGKMNVLAQTLDHIEADIVLITDADCIVNPKWIGTFVDYFEDDTGMVGGLTMLTPLPFTNLEKTKFGLFKNIQALDWLLLQTIAASSSNARLPITILGNNFGFRMQAYRAAGTFKKMRFSVTEDYALLRAIEKTKVWKMKYTLDTDNTIFSFPVSGLRQFYLQRKRWIVGGKSMRSWGYFITGLSMLSHLFMVLVFIFMQWKIAAALGIGLIIGTDYFIINRQLKKLSVNHLKKFFIPFEIFHTVYLIFFGFTFPFMQKVRWKKRSFKK
ncbi:MAG TPA: glycosyltransferase [Caldithrix sp.]|nr:glycosyltransferase [Calditrichaceae bacterium]HEM49366.1 glycosyltransferase [Caldithrix sp.]